MTRICILKLRNSWEEYPKKTGEYYIIDHCGKKAAYLFSNTTAQWWRKNTEGMRDDRVCPSCTRFQWIDEEAT